MSIRTKLASILRASAAKVMPTPTMVQPMGDMSEGTLVDFRLDRFVGGGVTAGYVSQVFSSNMSGDAAQQTKQMSVAPKDVVDELKKPPSNFSLDAIDAKIAILEKKRNLISQQFSKEHVEFLMMALNCRKKFDKKCRAVHMTYREFFSKFDTTDEQKISALTTKYNNLVMKQADLFVPEFPDVAVEAMDAYGKAVKELTSYMPRFYVIATKTDFEVVNARRDPILIAQSPFGMYYYILGAWDKEMLYLPEL